MRELLPFDARPKQRVANETVHSHGGTWKTVVDQWRSARVAADGQTSYQHKPAEPAAAVAAQEALAEPAVSAAVLCSRTASQEVPSLRRVFRKFAVASWCTQGPRGAGGATSGTSSWTCARLPELARSCAPAATSLYLRKRGRGGRATTSSAISTWSKTVGTCTWRRSGAGGACASAQRRSHSGRLGRVWVAACSGRAPKCTAVPPALPSLARRTRPTTSLAGIFCGTKLAVPPSHRRRLVVVMRRETVSF